MFEVGSKRFVYLVALMCFTGTLILILLSHGTYDPGDGVQHYLIAKYALKHPLLLLNHWGKPIYTLLCLPFAQLGFIGSNLYNLLCNTLTAYLTFKIALKLNFKNAWVAFVLVFFSPLFFMTNFSGLTEPTFALILTSAIFLMLNSAYAWAAIIISFLPFARTEGFFIIPIFVIYLLVKKQWKYLFLTGLGTLLYAVIGYFVFNDFFWILHQNPYKGAIDIYGKGPLFHFVAANDRLFGLPAVALFIVGTVSLFRIKTFHKQTKINIAFLVYGSLTIYFVMHSIFWWKGLFGSLGLHRVMAGIAPLFGIVALIGFNSVHHFLNVNKTIQKTWLILVITVIVLWPLKQYHPPLKPDTEMGVLIETADWIKNNHVIVNQKVYCMYPYLGMLLNVDVFEPAQYISTCMLKFPDFSDALAPGDLIIWDSHFGHECAFNPTDIEKLPRIKLIKQFKKPSYSNYIFEVYVFVVQ